jgi:hypothetical protein
MASNTVGRFTATPLDGEPPIATVELPVLVRDALAAWLHAHGGRLAASDFVAEPRWVLPAPGCGAEPG